MQTYTYSINGNKFIVVDHPEWKTVRSALYNYDFCKKTGMFKRWGKTIDDDPQFSPIGPEILDIEISVNGCPNNCRFCSPANTSVQTPTGEYNIEDIKVGDKVIGANGREQTVEEVYERDYTGEMIEIHLANGRILQLTPEHPVILIDGSEKKAGELTENMEILSADDRCLNICPFKGALNNGENKSGNILL